MSNDKPLTDGQKFVENFEALSEVCHIIRCKEGTTRETEADWLCEGIHCSQCKPLLAAGIDAWEASKQPQPVTEPEPEETEFQKWFRGWLKDGSYNWDAPWDIIEREWSYTLKTFRIPWNAMADLAVDLANASDIEALKVKE